MSIYDILTQYPTRSSLFLFMRPSDIVNLAVSVTTKTMKSILLTEADKKRYLTVQREILKDTKPFDDFIKSGGTVLFIGKELKAILSKYITTYRLQKKGQYKESVVLMLAIRPHDKDLQFHSPISTIDRPTLVSIYNGRWLEDGLLCNMYRHIEYSDSILPDELAFPRELCPDCFGSWYINRHIVEDDIVLVGSTGSSYTDIQAPDNIKKLYYSAMTLYCSYVSNQGKYNQKYLRNIHPRITEYPGDGVPYIDASRHPNTILKASKNIQDTKDHVPVLLNLLYGESVRTRVYV